jgi:hypothetical protein
MIGIAALDRATERGKRASSDAQRVSSNRRPTSLPRILPAKEMRVMIHVTETATQAFARYFENKDVSPIRILFNSGG